MWEFKGISAQILRRSGNLASIGDENMLPGDKMLNHPLSGGSLFVCPGTQSKGKTLQSDGGPTFLTTVP